MYTIQYRKSVEKYLRKLDKPALQRIVEKIYTLRQDPRPHGVKKLEGEKNLYRVRQGDYRIIYEIHDNVLIVEVIKIGHRSDVYRNK